MLNPVFLAALFLLCVPAVAWAQSLPPTASNVYKCVSQGRTVYSDAPCLGAARVDVTPTRGVNKTTGRLRVGKDVRDELRSEALARALQPLTSQDAVQWKKTNRRAGLAVADRTRCEALDRRIAAAEAAEAKASARRLPAAQRKLLALRTTFFDLRC